MRQRLLLLPCDEGGTPHGAAVAVPEPAHRGWRRVGGTSKAMVRLGLCSERRGWTPHHHRDKKLVSKCCFFCFGGFLSLYFPKAPNMTRDPLLHPVGHTGSLQKNTNNPYHVVFASRWQFSATNMKNFLLQITPRIPLGKKVFITKKEKKKNSNRMANRKKKKKGTQMSLTCRWPSIHNRVEVLNSNSKLRQEAAIPMEQLASQRRKYNFLTAKPCNSPFCRL